MTDRKRSSLICDALLEAGKITAQDAARSLSCQEKLGGHIGAILIRLGAISEDSLLEFFTDWLQTPLAGPEQLPDSARLYLEVIEASGIALDWWLDQELLAWFAGDDQLNCIAREPFDPLIGETLEQLFPERTIHPMLTRNYDLDRALEQVENSAGNSEGELDFRHLREIAEEAPVIEFVSNLLSQALDQRASDIHIEPGKKEMEVRFRIDGVLHNRFTLPVNRFPAIGSRIKLISGIDISERRLPQDGRVSVRISGTEVDLRVSSVPGIHGESIVLRLLPKETGTYGINDLGLLPDHRLLLESWVTAANGIILVTGPTGSGKSTTLYAALDAVNDGEKKIITVEDPVEYYLDGITQIQTHSEIGYTFSRALRSIMRQDPDIVMVGEIRDRETAEIAIQASLTGHLVLSTLHTNSSLAAFVRLIDMGIDPFLVATPIRAVMAQRLVRRLCPFCAEDTAPPSGIEEELACSIPQELRSHQAQWKQAKGCKKCQNSGYKGRAGIHELVSVTPRMQELILRRESEQVMWKLAKEQNIRNMRQDGLLKARRGLTSVEEVYRVVSF